MEGNVELKTVGELFNMEFRIPSYQRGYRWRDVHVETLLNDLKIFKEQIFKDDNTKDFYSLQPLVVVKTEGDGREKIRSIFLRQQPMPMRRKYFVMLG